MHTLEARITFLQSQIVCAQAEIEAMKVFNLERERNGYAPGYDEKAFLDVPSKYGLEHNKVVTFLNEGN